MKKIAYLFPGQGAQYPSMAKDFYDTYSQVRSLFHEADEILQENFSSTLLTGSKETLTLTKNSQIAIFLHSSAILEVLKNEQIDLSPSVCSGLSLGEYTALYAAGKLSFTDCLTLIRDRAQLMNASCEKTKGTMAAIFGFDETTLLEITSSIEGVWIANINCPGQIVISGTIEGIEKASQLCKEKGAKRVIPLQVHGAFHSGLLQEAEDKLLPKIEAAHFINSSIDLVMNVPGDYVSSLKEIKAFLGKQITRSVRWEQSIRSMMKRGVDAFIEIGCGTTLTGMNRKIGASPAFSIDKVEDLDRFLQEVRNVVT